MSRTPEIYFFTASTDKETFEADFHELIEQAAEYLPEINRTFVVYFYKADAGMFLVDPAVINLLTQGLDAHGNKRFINAPESSRVVLTDEQYNALSWAEKGEYDDQVKEQIPASDRLLTPPRYPPTDRQLDYLEEKGITPFGTCSCDFPDSSMCTDCNKETGNCDNCIAKVDLCSFCKEWEDACVCDSEEPCEECVYYRAFRDNPAHMVELFYDRATPAEIKPNFLRWVVTIDINNEQFLRDLVTPLITHSRADIRVNSRNYNVSTPFFIKNEDKGYYIVMHPTDVQRLCTMYKGIKYERRFVYVSNVLTSRGDRLADNLQPFGSKLPKPTEKKPPVVKAPVKPVEPAAPVKKYRGAFAALLDE